MKSWQVGKKPNPQICIYKKWEEMDALTHPWHKFQTEDNIVFLLLYVGWFWKSNQKNFDQDIGRHTGTLHWK